MDYGLSFVSAKTYYPLETSLSMPGISLVNCLISAFGLILMYKIMPETENRSLEDIEAHFSDRSKSLTDRKIARIEDKEGESDDKKRNDEVESGNEIQNDSIFVNGDAKTTIKLNSGHNNRGYVSDS